MAKILLGISPDAKALIANFESTLTQNLKALQVKFPNHYDSIEDLLRRKYNLQDVDKMNFPDFSNKTEFIICAPSGKISTMSNVLTYSEADKIIEAGLYAPFP